MNLYLNVGDPVEICSYEGFSGPGVIIDERNGQGSRFKIRMDSGNPPEFWAHDFEVMPSGSGFETVKHIQTVQRFLSDCVKELERRSDGHDESKLGPEEKPHFDRETPKLKTLVYGSPDYKQSLEGLGPALQHHYQTNTHHPEHYAEGVSGMDLFDVIEMLCDWRAAAKRLSGDGAVNMDVNIKRFKLEPQLASILQNTLERWPK